MSANILWFTVVSSYIVQTKCFSRILSRQKYSSYNNSDGADNSDGVSTPIQNLSVQMAIVYFASWLLLLPIARIWNITTLKSSALESGAESSSSLNLVRSTDNFFDETTNGSRWTRIRERFRFCSKILLLSILLVIPIISYTVALSLSPAFDVTLIQNTSTFEIVTLLYGVFNIAKRKNVFRNFVIMMVALMGILIVSYTNATCDLLAGKLSINKETGEVNDPFLFDRLKASLLCGLCSLALGPFAVLSQKWLTNQRAETNRKTLFFITITCIVLLLPLLPKDSKFFATMAEDNLGCFLLLGIVGGIVPNVISIIMLNKCSAPEFITTTNLAIIVLMGLSQWICESNETFIVRWEVIGYLMLTVSGLALFFTLRPVKNRN
ncbi:uncharacterized protein KNAG_0K01310 [Huiozyma naganishii CBS 8797]|uniref:EamA domain-containing protein n=1 Tax=Huiozyma naganishii (strain ATCC MYA-139 / BCRC 22969 / CBS 8797 / KCTC 17520 / NBRC 10181 / NCYC 3082 / Yp74L-3) TaxID=1071383 RepID=J7SAV7_HUIN7|nr:hypothetical protein KNAG_0K01310 [Kazachstania naganishii CBS 8797]CCK72496.1 hypothetical protein KNAG_0K01310 [Kazachstania naganishii CBS 8797]